MRYGTPRQIWICIKTDFNRKWYNDANFANFIYDEKFEMKGSIAKKNRVSSPDEATKHNVQNLQDKNLLLEEHLETGKQSPE